jgi:hypothetical protein
MSQATWFSGWSVFCLDNSSQSFIIFPGSSLSVQVIASPLPSTPGVLLNKNVDTDRSIRTISIDSHPIRVVQDDLAIGSGCRDVRAELAMRPLYVSDFYAHALVGSGGIVLCIVDQEYYSPNIIFLITIQNSCLVSAHFGGESEESGNAGAEDAQGALCVNLGSHSFTFHSLHMFDFFE